MAAPPGKKHPALTFDLHPLLERAGDNQVRIRSYTRQCAKASCIIRMRFCVCKHHVHMCVYMYTYTYIYRYRSALIKYAGTPLNLLGASYANLPRTFCKPSARFRRYYLCTDCFGEPFRFRELPRASAETGLFLRTFRQASARLPPGLGGFTQCGCRWRCLLETVYQGLL